MLYSQEHLKTMVYAKCGGQTVYYGELENREYYQSSILQQRMVIQRKSAYRCIFKH